MLISVSHEFSIQNSYLTKIYFYQDINILLYYYQDNLRNVGLSHTNVQNIATLRPV